MGRSRTKKQVHAKLSSSNAAHQQETEPSISSLIQKAQDLIVQCNYDLAQRFVKRILERNANNVEAKEMLGVIQLETGELEDAKLTFTSLLTATASNPPPPSAHLYLAQLSDDPNIALKHYQEAVNIMLNQLKGKAIANDQGAADDLVELKTNIVRALIGQVELWMDASYDLCFEEGAEQKCEELLLQALSIAPGNAEALQALASVRLSQQRPEEAKECLEQSWSSWKDLDLDDPNVPPISSRLSLTRLFLEVALFAPALLVIHGVLSADDEEVEAWYLEGWCYYLMAEEGKENGGTFDDMPWQELAQDSCNRLERCRLLHIHQQHPDEPLLDHVKELLAKLVSYGLKPVIEEADEDDQWENVESSDEDVEMS